MVLTFHSRSMVDTVVPLAYPVKSADGRTEITEIFVPKNTTVHFSVAAMNRSRAIWGEDAKEFKPQRWLRADGPSEPTAFGRVPGVFSSMYVAESVWECGLTLAE